MAAPGSKIAGKSIAEWTGAWWSWLLTTPLHRDPALDERGEHCGVGQDGPVWFLAGAYGDVPMKRRCKVPEGKYVLFPMQTALIKPNPEQTQVDCNYSRDKAARVAESVLGLYASVDGAPVTAPERFRERTSACFDPDGTGRALSAQDGHWIMLSPLSPGRHILRYGRDEKGGRENTDISYILEVGKEASPGVIELKPNEGVPFAEQIRPKPLSALDKKSAAREPTYEDFPTYLGATMRPRPGFGLRDFQIRLVALILREGKYKVVSYNRKSMGATAEIRFTWPDIKERYAASEDLKRKMPHPMTVPMRPNDNGSFGIFVGGVDPNTGSSFALRAEIVADAARLVTEALNRRRRSGTRKSSRRCATCRRASSSLPGKTRAAAASVGVSSTEKSTDCDGWTANFGKTAFRYALPEGYMPYNGDAASAGSQQGAGTTRN